MATQPKIPITGNNDADLLLEKDPLALLIGMLLDQQVTMEKAFAGPLAIKERMGSLDVKKIANMSEGKFLDLFREKPAIHRFPSSMASRVQKMCQILINDFDGKAQSVWQGQKSAQDVYDRLRTLPGYGDEKAKIFIAILVKRLGYSFDGYKKVAAPFSDSQPRTVADVADAKTLEKVHAFKKAQKAKGKGKAD
jgi:uncharacterized HhH-GPD family protein